MRATFCTCLLKDAKLRNTLYPSSPTPVGALASNFGDVVLRTLVSAASTPIAGSNQIPYESLVVSFSIATIQTQLLSPRSRPQLVLSSKLDPSQCADTSVTDKGNFLETMMLCPRDWQDAWCQARGRRLVRIAIQRSGDAISFSSLQPEIEVRRATRAADTGCYARHDIPGIVP